MCTVESGGDPQGRDAQSGFVGGIGFRGQVGKENVRQGEQPCTERTRAWESGPSLQAASGSATLGPWRGCM